MSIFLKFLGFGNYQRIQHDFASESGSFIFKTLAFSPLKIIREKSNTGVMNVILVVICFSVPKFNEEFLISISRDIRTTIYLAVGLLSRLSI